MHSPLLRDILAFLNETGMGEYRFGLLAAKNGRLLQQLRRTRRNGDPARVWPETETRIRAFMMVRRERRARAAKARAARASHRVQASAYNAEGCAA